MTVLSLVRSAPIRRLSRRDWAVRISACWRGSVEKIIETGKLLIEAKALLAHGSFMAMIENDLAFGARTAQMVMAIAGDERLSKANHGSLLPASWRTIYEIHKLDDATFSARLKDGTINPEMERNDLLPFFAERRGERRLAEMRDLAANPLALPTGMFAAGIADPPWENPAARIGMSPRHYRDKYPTMSPAEIAVMRDTEGRCPKDIFGKTAFLALWVPRHILAIGAHVEVLRAWGFEPKSVWTWDKKWRGLGNGYLIDITEHIVIATRGKPKAPGAKLRAPSLFAERRSGKHSEKPRSKIVHKYIELWFPDMSYVELFARQGKGESRKGWVAWGNEAAGG